MAPDFGMRRALLLQGPMGPFFRRFAAELRARGVRVTKVNFNAGDGLFYPGADAVAYRGTKDGWAPFLEGLIRDRGPQAMYIFGDGRPYHRVAIEVARRLGVRIFVFEEGYLRPDWITLEEGGVNGHSSMPRDADFFLQWAATQPTSDLPRPQHVGPTMRYSGWYSTLYSLAMTLGFFLYPHYTHHRPLNAWAEAYRWVRGGLRKQWFAFKERDVLSTLVRDADGSYFVLALQVHNDYQLRHSPFPDVETFLEHAVRSFSQHAPKDTKLVVKHHPLDRPYREYGRYLRELSRRYGLGARLIYVHDLHLPTLLQHARGAVMINSTVGLQALHLGTPVKTLGTAVYDFQGLTAQEPLEVFWRQPTPPDPVVYRAFRAYLLRHNQANGSFYKPLPGVDTPTGVRWFGRSEPVSAAVEPAPAELRAPAETEKKA